MSQLPKQGDQRTTFRRGQKSPIEALGEPWPSEYIDVVRRAAELKAASRTVFWTVAIFSVAFAAIAVPVLVGEHRESSINLFSSIAGVVLAFVAAGLSYQFAWIAKRVESSLKSEISELQRSHEIESLILLRALEVFGDSERAIEWMRENNSALDNVPPIRVIQTEEGRREVLNVLGRIQHGVIS